MPGEGVQLRFAVLHHTGIEHSHFDLLIETASTSPLLTFRCDRWPLGNGDQCVRQPDHRRIYLDYEGPISGNRGEVERIASGPCEILRYSPEHIVARLSGVGVELRTTDGKQWRVTVR